MKHPVKFILNTIECSVSIEQAISIRDQLDKELAACRTKCPTCRCLVLPQQICSCCSDDLELDPLI